MKDPVGLGPKSASSGDPRSGESTLRFNLNVQKSRAAVYTLAVAVGLLDRLLGSLQMSFLAAPFYLAVAGLSAAGFHELYRRRVDARLGINLNPYWMACDVGLISLAVYLSGAETDWFVWYLSNTAAAAFVGGIRTALAVALADVVAYVGVLGLLGRVTGLDPTLLPPLLRMTYLFGAAFFPLLGISTLRQRRGLIKHLRHEESLTIEELTRVSRELSLRTQELSAANLRLVETAVTDTLTGLRNRRFIEAQLLQDVATVRRAYGEAQRGRKPDPRNCDLGVLLLDLDHFKRVNDVHGHDAGDEVLRQSAEALKGCLRENDCLVRWGGEEFLMLLRHTNGEFMPLVARRLLRAVSGRQIELPRDGAPLHVTVSIGWSFFPLRGEPLESQNWTDILKLADLGLYVAKRNGRNMAVGLVGGERTGLRGDLRQLMADLPKAVEAGHVRVVSSAPVADLDMAGS